MSFVDLIHLGVGICIGLLFGLCAGVCIGKTDRYWL